MIIPPSQIEPDYPYPPRFWWTKRIVVVVAVVLLITLGVRIWRGRRAQARFDAAIESLRARGEPVLMEDFNLPRIPDGQNYVFYLNQALAALSVDAYGPSGSVEEFPSYPPLPPRWYKLAQEAEAGNAKSLQLARQARQFAQVNWDLQLTSPAISLMLPSLNQMRQLANVLGDTAMHQHLQGRDDEAIETLRDVTAQSRALGKQPVLVSHLVGTGIYALVAERAQFIAPGLKVADNPAQPGTATRQQVWALIEELLSRDDRGYIYAMQGERMFQIDMNHWLTQQSSLLKPMFQLDILNALEYMEQFVTPATQPTTFPARAFKGIARSTSADFPNIISSYMRPSLNRTADTYARARAEGITSAISLAARLYQMDHGGQWPMSLDALVPDYLPAVPTNPRTSKSQPMRYILHNGNRPLVYIDTFDGDLTSELARLPSHPLYGWQRNGPQFRDLSRFPATAPTTQP